MPLHKTKNDLPEPTRTKVCEILNSRLADAIDLYSQVKQAHWNVKGTNFISLHELFDKIGEVIENGVDEIAERAVALGGTAEGTIRAAAKKSTLSEYSLTITDGKDHVQALSTALAHFGKGVRKAIDETTELRDADTADLFTGISRDTDKYLWMLEAHLQ
jgi:starvation-inducible DNA-binding protein